MPHVSTAPRVGTAGPMAYTSREIAAPPAAVWAVLVDAERYPDWLVGAARIRDVDDEWPAVGSQFHHRVGLGWASIPDSSEVLDLEYCRMLRLAVRARPLISAVATFRLVGDADRTMLSLEEEPQIRSVGNLVRPVMDPPIHVRNHRSLRQLARIVERRTATS
jgi:hypothetical protein